MNIQALNKRYENGHKLIIVTSRGLGHLKELKKKITFPFTFIGADGAIILNEKDELKIHSIKGQIYNEIAKDALERSWNMSITTIHKGNWYWHSKDTYPIKNTKKRRTIWQYIIEKPTLDPHMDLIQIKILVPENDLDIFKALLMLKYNNLSIFKSANDALTIQAPHARKDKAVSDIINTLALSPDNIYIVGDSNDDIAIFKLTQNSYCMEDGEKLAKIYAPHLTSSIYDLIFNKLSRLLI